MDCIISRQIISARRIRSDIYSLDNKGESCTASVACLLSVLSSLVGRVVGRNDRVNVGSPTFSPREYEAFNGMEVPDMSIKTYLERIFRYVHCSPTVFVVAYAYIDRLIQFHPSFRITSLNVHRLLITAVMVASKFVEDINYKNSHYAKVGGFSTEEMNILEVELLFLRAFKLQVTVTDLESYCCHLEREVGIGGGFQIERSLRLSCTAKDATSMPKSKAQICGFRPSLHRDLKNRQVQ